MMTKPHRRHPRPPHRPALYPWDEWFARGRLTLERGKHYRCTQSAMAQQIRGAASARRLSVSVVELDQAFRVVVVGPREGR